MQQREELSVSVVLPTYRRPELLSNCLESLICQNHPACEVIVGCRKSDNASREVLSRFSKRSAGLVREVVVGDSDNLVCSLNAALAQTSGQLVALTDDDAELPRDWLKRLRELFNGPSIGGVGGKDIQFANPGRSIIVGKLQWFGRMIGNHHLGVGPIRNVDILKGVNCCFRGDELRTIGFDRRLRGAGNVSNWELGVCFAFARQGFKLVFDPSLEVIHHTGPRHDGDTNNRGGFNGPAHCDSVYNETLLVVEHLPLAARFCFLIWSFMIGSKSCPGIAQLPRVLMLSKSIQETGSRWKYTVRGQFIAIRDYVSSRNQGFDKNQVRPFS